MTQLEILEELKKLPTNERLKIIEAVLGQNRKPAAVEGAPRIQKAACIGS